MAGGAGEGKGEGGELGEEEGEGGELGEEKRGKRAELGEGDGVKEGEGSWGRVLRGGRVRG